MSSHDQRNHILEILTTKGKLGLRGLRSALEQRNCSIQELSSTLQGMLEEGLLRLQNRSYRLAEASPKEGLQIVGILRKHPRGFGFVAAEAGQSLHEVFIPREGIGSASDGDRVEALVRPGSLESEKGPDGRIVQVLERARSEYLGLMTESGLLIKGVDASQQFTLTASEPVSVGTRLRLHILSWPSEKVAGQAQVLEVLGDLEDPRQDVRCAVVEFGLRTEFSDEVLDQAMAHGSEVRAEEYAVREDLRRVECITIDPETAKDFDDALSLVISPRGNLQLGVHIADVAHYVPAGSPLDLEARRRCNSTYFPGTCVPMLPPCLADHLCSLRPHVDRLAVTVFMEFNPAGELLRYRIARTVIRSAQRFSYEEAMAVLEGKADSPHAPMLHAMHTLGRALRAHRMKRGSLELALPSVQVRVDEEGMPIGLETHPYDASHQLVEEFMLKANEVVAAHLTKRGMPVAYRIHAAPSPSDFTDFIATARSLGFRVPTAPKHADLARVFQEASDSPHLSQLAVAFVRSMKLAYYSPDNIGHYGLGLDHYCHFTSPIRRYSDLVAQRALFGEPEPMLGQITEACSERERRSAAAEESVLRLKKLRLLRHLCAEQPDKEWPAVVTRVRSSGVIFEVPELQLDGFLHVSELGNEYFHYQERRQRFVGDASGSILGIGDPLRVSVAGISLSNLQVSWIAELGDL